MDKNSELTKAFTAAIGMEKRGYEFYIKSAKKSKTEFERKVFEALAEDENRHIDAINGYCINIAKRNETPELCTVMPSHEAITKKVIFGRREADLLKGIKTPVDEFKAYETALKMENDGYDFYTKALEATQDHNARELYEFLRGEEKSHYEIIANTYEYLRDPQGWFIKEEKPIVEG